MRSRLATVTLALAATLAGACTRERAAAEDVASAPAASAAPGAPASAHGRLDPVIDSLLGAFRAGLAEPTRLEGGAATRDALAAAFVRATAARDTQALRALHVTRAEFAYLYFPTARIALPPYGIDPGLLWLQLTGTGSRDLARAEAVLPPRARLVALECPEPPRVEGENRLHERCLSVVERTPGGRDTLSLFGSIVERDGRFKLLSFVNRL